MITTNEEIYGILESRRLKSKCPQRIVDTISNFFAFMEYNLDEITEEDFEKYLAENKVTYRDGIRAISIFRGILITDFGLGIQRKSKTEQQTSYLYMCDIESDAKEFLTKDEWDDFSAFANEYVKNDGSHALMRNYLRMILTWNGISRDEIKTIKAADVEEDCVSIREKDELKKVKIDNEMFHYFYKEAFGDVTPEKTPFASRKLLSYKFCDHKAMQLTANDLFVSGLLYRISQGDMSGMPKSSSVIVEYYKMLSHAIYGREVK